MKCYVVLTAGGIGSRVGSDIPKQFIHVNDKPVIAYTMEAFQRHPSVEGIVVACLEGWEKALRAYSLNYGITKLIDIVTGGATNQQSIAIALNALDGMARDDDFVLIHDGNRPLVSQDIISNAIITAEREGSAVTVIPATEVVVRKDADDELTAHESICRESLARTQTPHVMGYRDLVALHRQARKDGVESAALPELLVHYDRAVHLCSGDELNFKITTGSDLEIFKALIEAR